MARLLLVLKDATLKGFGRHIQLQCSVVLERRIRPALIHSIHILRVLKVADGRLYIT